MPPGYQQLQYILAKAPQIPLIQVQPEIILWGFIANKIGPDMRAWSSALHMRLIRHSFPQTPEAVSESLPAHENL